MVIIEKKTTTQNEKGSTPETNVDVSQKEQEIKEVVVDSEKAEEMLNINQKTTVSSALLEKDIAKAEKNQAINTVKEATKKDADTIEDAVLKSLSLVEVQNVVKNYDNEKLKATINYLLEKYENLSK